jgi:hypothetical protein
MKVKLISLVSLHRHIGTPFCMLSWPLSHSFHHQFQNKVSICLFLHKQQNLAVVIIPFNRMLLSFSCAILSPSAHVLDCRITFASALHNFEYSVP